MENKEIDIKKFVLALGFIPEDELFTKDMLEAVEHMLENFDKLTPNEGEEGKKFLKEEMLKTKSTISFKIGNKYLNGDGVEKDEQEALNFFANGLDGSGEYHSMCYSAIGAIFYDRGKMKEAKEFFGRAALLGNSNAQYTVGGIFFNEQEYKEALIFTSLAVQQKNEHAINIMPVLAEEAQKAVIPDNSEFTEISQEEKEERIAKIFFVSYGLVMRDFIAGDIDEGLSNANDLLIEDESDLENVIDMMKKAIDYLEPSEEVDPTERIAALNAKVEELLAS